MYNKNNKIYNILHIIGIIMYIISIDDHFLLLIGIIKLRGSV